MDRSTDGPGRHPTTGAFRIVSAAEPGPLPDEVTRILERLAEAVRGVLGDEAPGTIGLRFGHRVVVAPVASPARGVDVADVDLARNVVLTVGGADPTPEGALLAQVLFLRTDVVVGYADARTTDGPTVEVLEDVLPALRDGPACRLDDHGTLALGATPEAIGDALEALADA